MTLLDGNLLKGWLRDRKVLKKFIELYLLHHSPLIKNYVDGIARVTGLDRDVILKSQPVKNLLKKIVG